jgi:uncharacterized protein
MELISGLMFVLIGFGTGFFSGLFGIGGGSVRVPLLALTGMPLLAAFATNMFAIPFSSAEGAFVQRKNIEWKVAKVFTTGGVIGIIIATILTGVVSSKLLAITFFVAAIITMYGLYLNKLNHHLYEHIHETKKNAFFGAMAANFIIGLRGGSGGTLFPPLLRALHVPMHRAIATSLFANVFTSIIALIIYLWRGDVVFLPAIIVAITGVVGSYAGSRLSLGTQPKWLKAGLSVVVFVLALSVVYGEFFG